MYNEEFKVGFTGRPDKSTPAVAFFKHTEKTEQEYKMDLCQMDEDIVKALAESYCGARSINIDSIQLVIQKYVEYCIGKGVDANKHLLKKIDIDLSSGMRKLMFSSPQDLLASMNNTFFPPSEKTVDSLYRGFLWCAFIGVPYKHHKKILITKTDELNLDLKQIIISHKIFELPDECLDDFHNLRYLNEFKYIHPLYSKTTYKQRVLSQYLFRGVDNKLSGGTGYISFSSIANAIRKKQSLTDGRIFRFTNVYRSGVFYRALLLERNGLRPDFNQFILDETGVEGVEGLRNGKITPSKRKEVHRCYNYAMKDYAAWKKAFNLK